MAGAPKSSCIVLSLLLLAAAAAASPPPFLNSSLPDPSAVVADFHSKVSSSRRRMQQSGGGGGGCMTGNPIDDCWRCAGTDWRQDRQRLADCGIGFGRNALGGKGGPIYVVTDSSDRDPVNPVPGTLRHAVIQEGPLWIMYAIGGSASPTINSQGNRYIAPANPNAKEVTKRVDTAEGQWSGWNWRTEGDMLVNGAFFVPSGEGLEAIYEKATSVDPKSAALVDMLTQNAGVLGEPR
ncbi:hypothetical protein PR202_gb08193 [Eleusine coracana subsp. coracana]|uniref:Pectate lyase n=1 Tax=Eleusine coracana subsp. coracana TaxID=191504 RepID=A0AAV5EEA6_ELECO|nr:hypothetical protein PR202_gb08193 [Eleusine coracana subsp. coracana]